MEKAIIERIQRRMELDEYRNAEYSHFDNMDDMKWDLPTGWESKDWIRKSINPHAHNALKDACNIFDTHNPKWNVVPRGPQDKENAERLERWLEWSMQQANTRSGPSPFRTMLRHAIKYDRICAQLECLAKWLPADKTKYTKWQKMAVQEGYYSVVVHNPGTVYYEMGKWTLRWVAVVSNVDASSITDYWNAFASDKNDSSKKIQKALNKIKALVEDDTERVIYVDYTDDSKRYVFCVPTSKRIASANDLSFKEEDVIEILNEENKMSFINWVVVEGNEDSLLAPLHRGNLWENQNLLDTIEESTVLRRAFFPVLIHNSPTGNPVDIRFDGSQIAIENKPGEQTTTANPPPIDPGVREITNKNMGQMSDTTGLSALQSVSPNNVQNSTYQAFVSVQMMNLEPYKSIAQKALSLLGKMAFLWLNEIDEKIPGYNPSNNKRDPNYGQQLEVGKGEFDADELVVSCELVSNTATNKMQRVNEWMTLKNGGAPIDWIEVFEQIGIQNPEAHKATWLDEQIEGIALKTFSDTKSVEFQQLVQQLQAAVKQASQPAPAPTGGAPLPANSPQPIQQQAQGQGFDAAQGGMPPSSMSPTMTQGMQPQ